ncbi:glycerophosphoryl diester phosphodiesterase [Gordonia sinesedis]
MLEDQSLRPAVTGTPVAVIDRGHRVALKWHRARRGVDDAPFTAARIVEAMRVGASVEIDLVLCADDRFVVLHDKELAGATTGQGSVRDHSAAQIGVLQRKARGAPLDDRVLTLDGLADLLAAEPIHPDALLQLDIKEDATSLSLDAIAWFADAVSGFAEHAIVSCGDAAAVTMLTAPLADLRVGFDPCHRGAADRAVRRKQFDAFVERAVTDSPRAEMVYLERGLILAADRHGHDIVAAFHDRGRTVDAYTIAGVDRRSRHEVRRLIELRVDQITTDDPEGLMATILGGHR